jgi:hypothetical protein
MKTGDSILISPEVTHKSDWTQGTVIEVEANPYHGAYYEIKRMLAKHEFYWIHPLHTSEDWLL